MPGAPLEVDWTSVYIVAGFLILANLSTILTVFISVVKLAAIWGEMKQKVETNSKDINNAHSKIRDIEVRLRV